MLGPPPPSPLGQVLRFDHVAAPGAMPGLPNTGAGGGQHGAPDRPAIVLLVAVFLGPLAALARRRWVCSWGARS